MQCGVPQMLNFFSILLSMIPLVWHLSVRPSSADEHTSHMESTSLLPNGSTVKTPDNGTQPYQSDFVKPVPFIVSSKPYPTARQYESSGVAVSYESKKREKSLTGKHMNQNAKYRTPPIRKTIRKVEERLSPQKQKPRTKMPVSRHKLKKIITAFTTTSNVRRRPTKLTKKSRHHTTILSTGEAVNYSREANYSSSTTIIKIPTKLLTSDAVEENYYEEYFVEVPSTGSPLSESPTHTEGVIGNSRRMNDSVLITTSKHQDYPTWIPASSEEPVPRLVEYENLGRMTSGVSTIKADLRGCLAMIFMLGSSLACI